MKFLIFQIVFRLGIIELILFEFNLILETVDSLLESVDSFVVIFTLTEQLVAQFVYSSRQLLILLGIIVLLNCQFVLQSIYLGS